MSWLKKFSWVIGIAALIAGWLFLPTLFWDKNAVNTTDIDKIIQINIQDINGSLTLSKQNEHWFIDKDVPADKDIMKTLLTILQNIQTLSFTDATAIFDNDSLQTTVTIWNQRYMLHIGDFKFIPFKQKLKTLHCIKNSELLSGEAQLLVKPNNKNEAYYAYLPGSNKEWTILLSSHKDLFLSREVLNLQYFQIKHIKMHWTDNPENSFEIKQDNGFLQLYSLSNNKPIVFDTLKMLDYLSSFTEIFHEGLLNNKLSSQNLSSFSAEPSYELQVTDNAGKLHTIKAFPKFIYKNDSVIQDPNSLFLLINQNKDTVTARYFLLDPIAKRAGQLQ